MANLKIYFAGSIRGGREDAALYKQIIKHLAKHGNVLTEHLGDNTLTDMGEDKPAVEVFERDVNWVKEADVIVAEVTTPSLGVGYEIGKAEEFGKKTLCLYRGELRKLTPMVAGNANLLTKTYETLEDAALIIDNFFKEFRK